MYVFRMNDYDWVAANTDEEAIDFYFNLTGVKENEENVKIEDLDKTIWVELLDVKDLDKLDEFTEDNYVIKKGDGDWTSNWVINLTYREALIYYGKDKPYIFASAEY